MKLEKYVSEKIAGKFFIRYAILCSLITFYVFQQEGKKIWYSLRKEKKKIFWQTIKLLFFFSLIHFTLKLILLGWAAVSSLPSIKSGRINTHISLITNSRGNWWKLAQIFFGLCVLAPLIEECIFRHFIFKIFGKKNPFSYLVSFFSFIWVHYHRGENILLLFLQYSVATAGFIYIYKKSNWNLLSPILLHSLVNFLFIIIILINPSCSLI